MGTGVSSSTSNSADSSPADNNNGGGGRGSSLTPPAIGERFYFLDNLKIFLTFLVVCHHCTCAFGACGEGGWLLSIGLRDDDKTISNRIFSFVTSSFVTINQGYFMSLF